jgi:hypothetical protein
VVLVGAEVVCAGRVRDAAGEVERFVEVFALHPELVLAGDVAGVVADLKGDDDDGADGPGLLLCMEGRTKANANAEDIKDAEERGGGRDTESVDAHGGAPVEGDVRKR